MSSQLVPGDFLESSRWGPGEFPLSSCPVLAKLGTFRLDYEYEIEYECEF